MHRHLLVPAGNALPGPWRFGNAPYLEEIVDTLVEPGVESVALMFGAQTGKTSALLGMISYSIAHDPASSMIVQPTEDDAKVFMRTKLGPVIEQTPAVAKCLAKPRGRTGGATLTHRDFLGGALFIGWSGSGSTLRGRSVPFLYGDEVDAYAELDKEGHPLDIASRRTETFAHRARTYATSTPTEDGVSRVGEEWEAGDRREWWITCPRCDYEHIPEWGIQRPDGTWVGVVWDKGTDGEHLTEGARYRCPACAQDWTESERASAIRAGRWIAARPHIRSRRSYQLPAWSSLLGTLSAHARFFVDSKRRRDMRAWTNLVAGRPYEPAATHFRAPTSPEERAKREEDWGPGVPEDARLLTCGVDVQMDRVEYEVVAWGAGESSWSIAAGQVWGDVLDVEAGPWREFDQLLTRTWAAPSGAVLPIRATLIDSGGTGGMTQAVYRWCHGKQSRGIFPCKGVAGWNPSSVVRRSKQPLDLRGLRIYLVTVAVDVLKASVMARLTQTDATEQGYVHVPRGRDPQWWEQMGSERLVSRLQGGRRVRRWELRSAGARNEALDCRVYAQAAMIASGLRLDGPAPDPPLPVAADGPPARKTAVRRKGRRVIRSRRS